MPDWNCRLVLYFLASSIRGKCKQGNAWGRADQSQLAAVLMGGACWGAEKGRLFFLLTAFQAPELMTNSLALFILLL